MPIIRASTHPHEKKYSHFYALTSVCIMEELFICRRDLLEVAKIRRTENRHFSNKQIVRIKKMKHLNFAQHFENIAHNPITDYYSLITIWCIFIANNVKNQPNYQPISSIRAIIFVIRDSFTSHESLFTSHLVAFAQAFPKSLISSAFFAQAFSKGLIGTILRTTPKLHHFYTEIDLEWVGNAFGTPRTNLEQCNLPKNRKLNTFH